MLEDVPAPMVQPGHVLIRTRRSVVSQGTEKMLVLFGKASLLQKARSQPEKVKQVLGKIRTDGLVATVEAVFRKLDEPLPLGYCNAGEVIAVGPGVVGYEVGERVASNGPHAEVVSVPVNLVAKVPSNVSDDAAAFTVIGAIGLQGIRLAKPELGETFVVIGLGLIGQVTSQLLKAHGCRVIGFDFDCSKVQLAQGLGAEAIQSNGELDPVKWVLQQTSGLGADGVLITASTSSDSVIAESARMCRKRGRIILIGVVGLNINRSDFYEKELTFQVSCSYGPGRYEAAYEGKGYDYPPAFVRWTENRNFQAVLQAMSAGALRVDSLITKRVMLSDYRSIYDHMDGGGIASLLVYDETEAGKAASRTRDQGPPFAKPTAGKPETKDSESLTADERLFSAPQGNVGTTIRICERNVGVGALAVIGAGNFMKMTAMPALAAVKAPVKFVVSSGGVTGTSLARKYEVPFSSTDYRAVLQDRDIAGVIITTRHNLHAQQTVAALKAGKCVLVEKPLCLTLDELREIEAVVGSLNSQLSTNNSVTPWVTVGYNRRFSPHAQKIKSMLGEAGPISVIATMNAGSIPLNHWVHDVEVGGGRLIGEACHFVDLAIFLTGGVITEVSALSLDGSNDTACILLRHANGSTSVVNYLANGNREVSKERVEVHSQGRTLLLDNFRELRGYGFRSFSTLKTRQDKGHAAQFALFARRAKEHGAALIPWLELANSTRATLAIPIAIAQRRWVRVDELA